MRLSWLFAPWKLLALLVAVFVLWQVFLFIQPRPRDFTEGELRAARLVAEDAVQEIAAAIEMPARIAVTYFSGDRQRRFTHALREALDRRPGITVIESPLIQQVLRDIAVAVAEATSIEEILRAGQLSEVEVIVTGRLNSIGTLNDVSRVEARVMAYDTRPGQWVVRRDATGEWQPPALERAGRRVLAIPAWQRLLFWLVAVLALPWVLPWPTWWAVRRQSNAASFAVVGGFTLLGLALTLFLTGFALQGAWASLRLLLAFVAIAAYTFWACERVGER